MKSFLVYLFGFGLLFFGMREISEQITNVFLIYSNHWDAFFGAVVPLFLFSVLENSCAVNLFLFNSDVTGIGLRRGYFWSIFCILEY